MGGGRIILESVSATARYQLASEILQLEESDNPRTYRHTFASIFMIIPVPRSISSRRCYKDEDCTQIAYGRQNTDCEPPVLHGRDHRG